MPKISGSSKTNRLLANSINSGLHLLTLKGPSKNMSDIYKWEPSTSFPALVRLWQRVQRTRWGEVALCTFSLLPALIYQPSAVLPQPSLLRNTHGTTPCCTHGHILAHLHSEGWKRGNCQGGQWAQVLEERQARAVALWLLSCWARLKRRPDLRTPWLSHPLLKKTVKKQRMKMKLQNKHF